MSQGVITCPLCAGYEMQLRPPDPVNGPPEEPETSAVIEYMRALQNSRKPLTSSPQRMHHQRA